MQQEVFLIKEGEIFLKGLNKANFEKHLIKNIKNHLHPIKIEIKICQSTILLKSKKEEDLKLIEPKIKNIFGISSYCKAVLCEKKIELIKNAVTLKFDKQLKNCATFRIKAKRSDKKFELNSMQIGQQIGAFLCSKYPHLEVDLNETTDLTIFIEIRTLGSYIYSKIHKGAGGLPVGCSGKAMLLISGGIDSPVAGWLMAKRGLELYAVHFFSPPYTSERALTKVEALLGILSEWTGKIYFYCVNFTKIQEIIKKNCDETLGTIINRRTMNKIAEQLTLLTNQKLKNKISALINGESLGQVASQTLEAIACSKSATKLPILQPLIGMDKNEIIELAKKINTFNTSILPFEDCCTVFVAKHPKTKPNLKTIIQNEKKIKNLDEMIKEAVSTAIFKTIEKNERY